MNVTKRARIKEIMLCEDNRRDIDEIKPDGFVLENVESLLHPKNVQAVQDLEHTINKIGYKFIIYRLCC